MRITCLLLFLFALNVFSVVAQERQITGQVTGKENNQPLAGVSVIIAGTKKGTTTDADGNFRINVSKGARLTISSLSYEPQTITIDDQLTLNIIMNPASNDLDEVVVTSFGIQRDKKTLGYGVSSVKAEALRKSPVPDITNALAGKIAGVQISGSGGGFTSSSVIIRGFSTFTGSNQPLYVVDGVPVDNGGGGNSVNTGVATSSRVSDINPEDIENVSVLKGAAATVLYGSRAASGAILITTKKGKKGAKNQVGFSSNFAVGSINRFPEYQNEYGQGDKGIYGKTAAGSWGPKIAGQQISNAINEMVPMQAYPDNVRDILQNSTIVDNNLSFSGATDKYNFRLSYGNYYETGLVPTNVLRKNTLNLSAGTSVTEKLKISTTLNFSNNISSRTQAGNQGSNPLWRGIYAPRSYDVTGLPSETPAGAQIWATTSEDNPYWAINHVTQEGEVNRFFGNVGLNYAFAPWLIADLKVGLDAYTSSTLGFDDKSIRGNGNTTSAGKGGLSDTKSQVRNLNSYFTLSGNQRFGDFGIGYTLGNEIVSNYSSSINATGLEIVVPGFSNLKNFVSFNTSDNFSKTRLIGVFADISLEYRNYLSVNLKARNDFSSTLGPDNRSTFYPAVAVSFNPAEAFEGLKGDIISSMKFRANAGEVGKSPGAYNTDTYYAKASAGDGLGSTGVSFPFAGLAGYTYSNSAGNPNLEPEFTREIELGGEFGFFKNRLFIDISVYKRDTRNLLFAVPVAATSGFTSLFKNAGKLSTKGIEFLVSFSPVKTEQFSWDATLTYTSFRSVVTELAPGVSLISLGGFTSPNIQAVAGEQYGLIYSNKFIRDTEGNLVINPANGLPRATSAVSEVGNPNPKFNAGFVNTFSYKGFSLSFLLDLKYKGDILSRTLGDLRINGVAKETADYERLNPDGTVAKPWMFDGVLADASGAPTKTRNNIPVSAQDYWGLAGKYVSWEGYVYDATYLKLREATLTYAFPSSMLGRTRFISGLSLSLYGRNLWTYAPNFPDLDPEQNLTGVSNARGLEFGIQPIARTAGISLRATF